MDELLTRFTADHPCWTASLLARVEESGADLERLEAQGLLRCVDGVYWLTDKGRERFLQVAAECWLDEAPGAEPEDPARCVAVTRLWLALDKGNLQRDGIKDYRFRLRIPVRPAARKLFSLDNAKLRWLWPDDPAVQAAARDFPRPAVAERRVDAVPLEKLRQWREQPAVDLPADLLFLCRYDVAYYKDFPGHPQDRELGLINSDRFFFALAKDLRHSLEILGLYQLWLHELRRVIIPGYVDTDTQEQSSVNWLLFVTESDAEARNLADQLRPFGHDLAAPAEPLELWTVSLQALEQAPPGQAVIWDLLPLKGHAVYPAR